MSRSRINHAQTFYTPYSRYQSIAQYRERYTLFSNNKQRLKSLVWIFKAALAIVCISQLQHCRLRGDAKQTVCTPKVKRPLRVTSSPAQSILLHTHSIEWILVKMMRWNLCRRLSAKVLLDKLDEPLIMVKIIFDTRVWSLNWFTDMKHS